MAENKEPSGAEKMFGDFAPALVDFTDEVLFGQACEGLELSPRERSLGDGGEPGHQRQHGAARLMEILKQPPTGKGPAEWFAVDVWFDVIYRGEEPSRARGEHGSGSRLATS